MISKENNFAYIDGANLHKGIKSLGWNMDYRRFGVWLSEKYGVKKAYIFAIILSTHPKDKCSILLKRTGAKISYIEEQRSQLELPQKEKAPDRDGTL